MRTLRAFGYEFGIELWCPVTAFDRWQLGTERWDDRYSTRLAWLGPLHFAACRLTKPQRDAA